MSRLVRIRQQNKHISRNNVDFVLHLTDNILQRADHVRLHFFYKWKVQSCTHTLALLQYCPHAWQARPIMHVVPVIQNAA